MRLALLALSILAPAPHHQALAHAFGGKGGGSFERAVAHWALRRASRPPLSVQARSPLFSRVPQLNLGSFVGADEAVGLRLPTNKSYVNDQVADGVRRPVSHVRVPWKWLGKGTYVIDTLG